MGALYRNLVRPWMSRMDPEEAHERAIRALSVASSLGVVRELLRWRGWIGPKARPVWLFGLEFPNRVGLAAGFDKNAVAWRALMALGFGHVEVGTVTYHEQPGNERPRIFRYPEQDALINRMGFNNDGAEKVAQRLSHQPGPGRRPGPLGINIGKSRVADIDEAVADYLNSFRLLVDHADYIAINVSSPNTPGLRQLQEEKRVRELLGALQEANRARGEARRPILLKIAPDLTFRQIDAVLQAIADYGIDGIIATNTTLARPGPFATNSEQGGLSGRPLRDMSTHIIDYIARKTEGKLPIIGVGGIFDSASAGEKLDVGASLVQIYTGMIYEGPWLGRDIAIGLSVRDR
ncbi:MAG: quinone-dependent dihydroorotate dehydrogenase, partial [Verrucomicrobia bacterium]